RDLMRGLLGAGGPVVAVALLTMTACRPDSAPSGFTLVFLGRSPAARIGPLSWAPDPDHSRLVSFDSALHVVRTIADPRLATPMAVAALHGRLLVTERTGEAVVFDTAGKPVRERESPFPASVNSAGWASLRARRRRLGGDAPAPRRVGPGKRPHCHDPRPRDAGDGRRRRPPWYDPRARSRPSPRANSHARARAPHPCVRPPRPQR